MMANMRKWMNGYEVRDVLDFLLSSKIEVVTIDENGRETGTKKRTATAAEKKVLRGIFSGAINAMNWGEEVRSDDSKAKAIIECAEFTAISLLGELRGGSERIQSYISVYCPLMKVLRDWERMVA